MIDLEFWILRLIEGLVHRAVVALLLPSAPPPRQRVRVRRRNHPSSLTKAISSTGPWLGAQIPPPARAASRHLHPRSAHGAPICLLLRRHITLGDDRHALSGWPDSNHERTGGYVCAQAGPEHHVRAFSFKAQPWVLLFTPTASTTSRPRYIRCVGFAY